MPCTPGFFAAIAQLAEHLSATQEVAGSIPACRSLFAAVAQSEEHPLRKWAVASSTLARSFCARNSCLRDGRARSSDAAIAKSGKASAFQADRRGFESRWPLYIDCRRRSSSTGRASAL